MPYSGASGDKKVPAYVKKLSASKRRQWQHVFNSEFAKHGDESRAFASANSVAGAGKKEQDMPRTVAADKSYSVKLYSHQDDDDLPQHVKMLPARARRNWIAAHNYHAAEYGNVADARKHADASTYMSVADLGAKEADAGSDTEYDDDDGEYLENDVLLAVKAELDAAARKKIPKGKFAYVDEDGKGHLPIHDEAHIRNAMARFNQTSMPSSAKAGAKRKIIAAARAAGIKVDEFSKEQERPPLLNRIMGAVKAALNNEEWDADDRPIRERVIVPSTWSFKEDSDGRIHVLAVYSNGFRDKHQEILPSRAHKEFEGWADTNGVYPDFYLWHCGPGTKWATGDMVAYDDAGFMMAHGIVDEGCEHIAANLKQEAEAQGLAVSHGFYGKEWPGGEYFPYRSFEISPLPLGKEANAWTGLDIASKEYGMPISAEKMQWLTKIAGYGDDELGAIAAMNTQQRKSLLNAGVDFKAMDDNDADADDNAEGDDKKKSAAAAKEQVQVKSQAQDDAAKGGGTDVDRLTKTITALTNVVKELHADVQTLKATSAQTKEDQTADAILARISQGSFKESGQQGTVLTKKEADELGAHMVSDQSEESFFDNMVKGSMASAFGGGGFPGANGQAG